MCKRFHVYIVVWLQSASVRCSLITKHFCLAMAVVRAALLSMLGGLMGIYSTTFEGAQNTTYLRGNGSSEPQNPGLPSDQEGPLVDRGKVNSLPYDGPSSREVYQGESDEDVQTSQLYHPTYLARLRYLLQHLRRTTTLQENFEWALSGENSSKKMSDRFGTLQNDMLQKTSFTLRDVLTGTIPAPV